MPGTIGDHVRPTSGRVREALFSMVGQDLQGWSVLDAFGGTGLLAFEAASRGAGPVLVVDRDPRSVRQIEAAGRQLGLAVTVLREDAARALVAPGWDLVLLDPPYAEEPGPWLERAAPVTLRCLVFEHRSGHRLPDQVGPLRLDRRREYGETALTLYRRG